MHDSKEGQQRCNRALQSYKGCPEYTVDHCSVGLLRECFVVLLQQYGRSKSAGLIVWVLQHASADSLLAIIMVAEEAETSVVASRKVFMTDAKRY